MYVCTYVILCRFLIYSGAQVEPGTPAQEVHADVPHVLDLHMPQMNGQFGEESKMLRRNQSVWNGLVRPSRLSGRLWVMGHTCMHALRHLVVSLSTAAHVVSDLLV